MSPPRLAYVGRRAYWEVEPGLYQATLSPDHPPALNGAGYRSLDALKRLKNEPAR